VAEAGSVMSMTPREAARSTFPDVSIDTPRLLLRPFRAADVADNALACRDNLSQRWLPLPDPYTDADSLAWCTEIAPAFRDSGDGIQWAIERKLDRRFVGSIGLKRTDWRALESEVGYLVAPWARGDGVAVEAVLTVARWLLVDQQFERLALRHAPDNLPSRRVAEKAGFTEEGTLRNAGFTNAGRVDLVIWSLVRSDLGSPISR
jgi:RimJ/RimL family protein N-acetyltransferase